NYFTEQRTGGTCFYLYFYVRSLLMVPFGEYHYLVLIVAAEEVVFRTFGNTFDQYGEGFAYILLHAFEGVPAMQRHNFRQPAFLHFFRHIILVTAGGQGPRAFGVGEHISQVVMRIFHPRQRILVVFFGFGAEASDDIS